MIMATNPRKDAESQEEFQKGSNRTAATPKAVRIAQIGRAHV
jgi:hypothetical protein